MNWIKITPETELPEEEVLAINIRGAKAVGVLIVSKVDQSISISGNAILNYITHYCIITNPEE